MLHGSSHSVAEGTGSKEKKRKKEEGSTLLVCLSGVPGLAEKQTFDGEELLARARRTRLVLIELLASSEVKVVRLSSTGSKRESFKRRQRGEGREREEGERGKGNLSLHKSWGKRVKN